MLKITESIEFNKFSLNLNDLCRKTKFDIYNDTIT